MRTTTQSLITPNLPHAMSPIPALLVIVMGSSYKPRAFPNISLTEVHHFNQSYGCCCEIKVHHCPTSSFQRQLLLSNRGQRRHFGVYAILVTQTRSSCRNHALIYDLLAMPQQQQQQDLSELWTQHQRRYTKTTQSWACALCVDRRIFVNAQKLWDHARTTHGDQLPSAEEDLRVFREEYESESFKKRSAKLVFMKTPSACR